MPLSTHYDQPSLTQLVDSGANLTFADSVNIIDIRGLASSLQNQLHEILSHSARAAVAPGPDGTPPATYYFHVEAGITMADLDLLLDHQNPRLAIQASGGSVGATLAGTISTATHGGEFRWPLLVDRVRAIHLVGPGGEEWWIEGDISIADRHRLQQIYPNIDHQHFIGGHWRQDGLTAQDVLNAVIVSMGTIGVVYSVVVEVVPQYGVQQIVTSVQTEGAAHPMGRALEQRCSPKARCGAAMGQPTTRCFSSCWTAHATAPASDFARTFSATSRLTRLTWIAGSPTGG